MKLTRIPTGIDSLDPVLDGGLPSGSLVLLLGEIGAGSFEFALTSSQSILMMYGKRDSITLPGKLCYISFTRSKEDIMNEIAFSFPGYHDVLKNCMQQNRLEFKDFSDAYFARSFIPASWRKASREALSFESLKWSDEEKNLVDNVIEYLDKNANGSIVIIDSLTALAQYCLERMEWKDLTMFLRGLQRAAKIWDGIIYVILSEGIFNRNNQEELSECVDGVIVFEWEKIGPSQRQRIMYMKKFRGLMPVLARDNIVNFEIQISSRKGFEVSNIKRVRSK